jgi:hypothetical protein
LNITATEIPTAESCLEAAEVVSWRSFCSKPLLERVAQSLLGLSQHIGTKFSFIRQSRKQHFVAKTPVSSAMNTTVGCPAGRCGSPIKPLDTAAT